VSHEHTLKNFRKFWYPRVFERPRFDPQAVKECPTLLERLNERAQELIETYQPTPLAEDVLQQIAALEAHWYRS
jgi:trimethylamine:corrinoid methyltransferase-like protein